MKSIFYALTLFISVVSLGNASTVSGTISLPEGILAGSGGVELEVSTFPIQFDDSFRLSRDIVTIAQGQASANYIFDLPEPPTFETFRLEFECLSGCAGLGITTDGFWSDTRGVTGSLLIANNYDSFVDHTIDILLEPADTFSGRVNFPQGAVASGEESIFLTVRDSGFLGTDQYLILLNQEAGATSVNFEIGVPNEGISGGWFVDVFCTGCDQGIIVETAQYSTTALGDPLSVNQDDRFFYRANNNYSGLELTMLAVDQPESLDAIIVPVYDLLLNEN